MTQHDMIEKLRNWNAKWESLGQMAFVRLAPDGAIKASSFPPKGLS